jgi:hypothetical protein
VVGALSVVAESYRRAVMSTHQIIAILALVLAVLSILPIPNMRPYWTLAVAVLLLALLQFV